MPDGDLSGYYSIMLSRLIFALCLLVTGCEKTPSSTDTAPDLAPPLRCGDTYRVLTTNVAQLPAPPLRDGIGNASMKITTSNGQAQAYFDCGLNLLHAFWEFEAYRAFQRATELDPDCAMAYWGIVMCMPGAHPEFLTQRTNALNRALALRDRVTARERAYMDALQALVNKGSAAFAEKLASQWKLDPSDLNAGALAAYYLKDGYQADGQQTLNQQRAIRIIQEVLQQSPNHTAALHYAIHIYELGPEIDLAIPLAERLAPLAPRAPHLVHMPGHIAFFRGDYASAITHFRAADTLDLSYHEKESIGFSENENLTHNRHFLALAYAEAGRLKEALLHAEDLKRTQISTARLRSEAAAIVAYEGRTLAGRLLMRCGQWQRAAEVLALESIDLSASAPRYYIDGLTAAARGLHAAESNNRIDLNLASSDLLRWQQLLTDSKNRLTNSEERHYADRAVRVLDLFARTLRAYTASSPATGKIFIQSLIEADAANYRLDPPLLPLSVHELAGAYYLSHQDAPAAKAAFQQALKQRPHSGYVLLGLARAAQLSGDHTATRAAYTEVIQSMPQADTSLPAISEALKATGN